MTQPKIDIVPSVGRKVWYYADSGQREPWDATVIAVAVDDLEAPTSPTSECTLHVIDPEGEMYTIFGVTVGDETTEGEHFRWMPYQQKQASKAAMEENAGTPLGDIVG